MRFWTYSEIREKIENDLDLQSETFILPEEMLAYVNEAIDEAEAEIHTIYEDYFLTYETLTLVSGTNEYDLPADIYAHKIREIVYNNGGNLWTMRRLRDWKKIARWELSNQYEDGQITDYFIINRTAGSPRILFMPPNKESGDIIKIWYLRNANRMVDDTDVCDIPEFVSFVIAFAKYKCLEKEGNPMIEVAVANLEQQRSQMRGVLSGMVADSGNEIEADYTHYEEHS